MLRNTQGIAKKVRSSTEKMKRMFEYRAPAPFNRLKMARLVSVLYSMVGGFTPGMMSWQHGGSIGCV